MQCAACLPMMLMLGVSLSGRILMKSFRMIARLWSMLRGLQWRMLAMLSKSGVKISSDVGDEEVSGGIS